MGRFANWVGNAWNKTKNFGRKVGGFLGKIAPTVKTVSGVLQHFPVIGPFAGLVNKGATIVEKVMDVIKPKQQSNQQQQQQQQPKDPPKQSFPALMAPKKQPRIIEPDDEYIMTPSSTDGTDSNYVHPIKRLVNSPHPANRFEPLRPFGPISSLILRSLGNVGKNGTI